MTDSGYKFEDGMEKKVKTFRQRGTGGDAMIIKIDHDKDELQVVETLTGQSTADMAERLGEDTEPRYLLYIHTLKHKDGRVQYPLALIMNQPPSSPPHFKTMYTRPLPALVAMFGVNKHFTLEDAEDLDDEWLADKLKV